MIKEIATAKINFGLQVVNKREDHYHNLQTIMIPIELNDQIYIYPSTVFRMKSNWNLGPDVNNLVYKAYLFMKEKYHTKKEMTFMIKKNIPIGAGLGGGSADAAAAIRGLNRFWKLRLTVDEMEEIASQLGSDIPFCVKNIPSIATSRGEELKPLGFSIKYYIALIIPPYSSFTKEVFQDFNIKKENGRFNLLLKCLNNGQNNQLETYLFNDLEEKVELMQRQQTVSISQLKSKLIQVGCIASSMSGSGSSVYGIFLNKKNKRRIKQELTNAFPQCTIHITKTIT